MNYIYDILLNFNSTLYDIFEWNKSDNLLHIRKIPLFRVNKKTLIDIISNEVKFDKEFLNRIFKKTETFNNDNINYAFLISDTIDTVAIKISNDKIKYSRLLIEEERETLEYCKSIMCTDIVYEKLKKINKEQFKTRNELKIKEYITKKINSLINNNNVEELKYLYLDVFNKKIDSNVNKKFMKELNENWDNVYLKLYNLLKLTESR